MEPVVTAPPANAGNISYVQITNDEDSGISTDNTYTHAIDFGTSGTATVNGVVFANDIGIAAGEQSNSGTRTYGPSAHAGNTPPAVSGDVDGVFYDMVWNGPDRGYIELTGLTSGQWYDLRLYDRAWDYQGAIRTYYVAYDIGSDGSVEFTTPKIDQNRANLTPPGLSGNVSWATSFVYQADTSGKIKVIIDLADDQTGTYHLYGLTNQAFGPMDPSPADGGYVHPSDELDLSWTNMDPNNPSDPVYVDVWFGTDPNDYNDFDKIVEAGEDVNSVTVEDLAIGTYYWRVDSYINGSPTGDPIEGGIWKFHVVSDIPVSVDAGDDMITWSGQEVQLDGTVEDYGEGDVEMITWSAEPADGVVFDPVTADVEDPIVTITKIAGLPTIVNGGFEDPVLADSDWTEGIDGTPGWSQSQQNTIAALVTDSTVYFGAGALNPDIDTYGYEAPVGENIGYMGSANNPRYTCLKQIIPVTLQAGWTYELSVLVGNPQAYNVSEFNPDGVAPDYEIALVAGGVIVESSFGAAPTDASYWKTASLSFTAEADHAQLGGQLEIWLIGYPLNDAILDPVNGSNSGGYELHFDDVRLTADGPLSTDASTVTLTLVAADAAGSREDTMEIVLYNNNCQAAIIGLGQEYDPSDFDADCDTDLEDYVEIAEDWLVDYELTEPVEKP